jgi:ABC-2 type transport system permease protein
MASAPTRAFAKLLLNEARLAWRQPLGPALGLALPLLLLVICGAVPALHRPIKALGGVTYLTLALPILMALVIAIIGIVGLPTPLVVYREQGILRRLSTTPAPPAWVLAAQLAINVGVALTGLTLLIGVGIAAFGLQAPKDVAGFALAAVLSIAAVFAIGLWIAAIARTSTVAKALSVGIMFPLLFFGGLWLPREFMPAMLRAVSDFTPLGASVQAVESAMRGSFPPLTTLAVLLGYAALFGAMAVKFFQWE